MRKLFYLLIATLVLVSCGNDSKKKTGENQAEEIDRSVEVDATQSKWIFMRLRVPYDAAPSGSHSVQVEISNPALGVVTEKSVFIMPR